MIIWMEEHKADAVLRYTIYFVSFLFAVVMATMVVLTMAAPKSAW